MSLGLLPWVGAAGPRERTGAQQGLLTTVHDVSRHRITIGRMPDSDVVVDDLPVSRRHAELRRDVIGIGHALLQLDGDRLVTFVDAATPSRRTGSPSPPPRGRTLLQPVSFTLPGRTLMAVIGPSGAGRSTLLNALTGPRPADTGDVRYADRDLYEDFDELRYRIALVPQDDVLHTQLTVRQALSYSVRLRFPADTTTEDRLRRIDEVLEEPRCANS